MCQIGFYRKCELRDVIYSFSPDAINQKGISLSSYLQSPPRYRILKEAQVPILTRFFNDNLSEPLRPTKRQYTLNQLHRFIHCWWPIADTPGEKSMSDEHVIELLQRCTMKPEDLTQLEDIKSRMEILSEIEKRLRLIVEELSAR